MDPLFFGLKRAFHSSLRIARRDFKELGLTPARMDVLYAVDKAHKAKRPVWQSQLRRTLGYTARSTMTQMLRALEALAWIRRKRSERDARQLEVELTQAGREKLARATFHFCSGWGFAAPDWAIDWPPPLPDETGAWSAYLQESDRLDTTLSNFRFALRDTSSVLYPWLED